MSAPLQVAFVMQDTGQLYGAERATLDLVAALHSRGDLCCSVILIRETRLNLTNSDIADEVTRRNIKYTHVSTDHAFSWKLVSGLREAVGQAHADCVHAVGYKSVFHCALLARYSEAVPWVSTIHGWLERRNLKEKLYKFIEVQSLKRANKVVVLSNYYYDNLARLGLPENKLALIPSGIQIDHWMEQTAAERNQLAGKTICIGILGRLSEEKNHRMFLRVAGKLVAQNLPVRFLIAGNGPLKSELVEQIRASGLQDHVSMPGIMVREEFFLQCDILTSCSHIENLPYSMMEAMACGVPVVTTAVGGVPDLVVEGETGWLTARDDDAGMAAKLRQLIGNPAQAKAFGAAGRRRIDSDFTLVRSAERHAMLYEEVLRHGEVRRE